MKKAVAAILFAGTLAGGGAVTADQIQNPYTDKGVTLEITATSTIAQAGITKDVVSKDTPKVSLSKWDGQATLGITYTGIPAATTGSRPFLSKNVEWDAGSQKMEVVPLDASTTMEDGGVEINVILDSEPATNQFGFAISGADNLDFRYQAPLWQEQGLKAPTKTCGETDCSVNGATFSRPLNVVGSYAVYYKDHKDHTAGQTNYATGKAYQIFRPLVTDANGASVWAEMSYANGTLTVLVPQDFLDNAVYPVKIDPTFGKTAQGASSSGLSANAHFLASGAPASSGTVTDIQIYAEQGGSGPGDLKPLLYTQTSSTAGTLLTNGIAPTLTSSNPLVPRWYVSTYGTSPTVTGGTTYWVGVICPDGLFQMNYDSGGSGGFFGSGDTYASPGSFTGLSTGFTPSAYADYTASGGGATGEEYTVQFN